MLESYSRYELVPRTRPARSLRRKGTRTTRWSLFITLTIFGLALSKPANAVEETSVVPTPGTGEADLRVVKGVNPFLASPDDFFEVVVKATNLGPDTATNVVLVDRLPIGASIVSTVPGCTIGGDGFTCDLGNLAASTTIEIVYQVLFPIPGLDVNTVTISSDTPDPIPGNNQHQTITGSQTTTTGTGQGADLALAKTSSPDKAVSRPAALAVPDELTYSISIVNYGPEAASDVTVLDLAFSSLTVPMNVHSVTPSQGSCAIGDARAPDGTLVVPVYTIDEAQTRCDLGTMPSGSTATITIQIETGGETGRVVVNGAQVVSQTPDPDLQNNATLILVPTPQILGDVNLDGVVDLQDVALVFDCLDDSGASDPACAHADVDGDGNVHATDASIAAERQTALPASNDPTATFSGGKNEKLGRLEKQYEYYLAYLRSSGPDRFTKTLALNVLGPLPDVMRVATTPPARNGVSNGQYKEFTDIPDNELVGVSGCETCIGVIILRPGENPLVFHFNGLDDVDDTLDDFGPFPEGTKAAVCGGNNSEGSNVTLQQVLDFFLDNPQIDVGMVDTIGLWFDNSGNFVLTNRDQPSNNLP